MDYFILYFFWEGWGKNEKQSNMACGNSGRGWQGAQSQGKEDNGRERRARQEELDSTLILWETISGWLCIDSNWRNHCLSLAWQAVLRQWQLWEPAAGIKDQCRWKRQGFEDLTQSSSQPSKSDYRLWNSLQIQALEEVLSVSLRWGPDVSNLHAFCLQGLCICKWLQIPNEYTASLKVACNTTNYFSVRLQCQLSNLY